MRYGQDKPSATAVIVAAQRARASRDKRVKGFSDPVALRLLPAGPASRVSDGRPRPLGRLRRIFHRAVGDMDLMVALRTVAIDEAIRGAPALPQVVNLGAGLDSRAWRMRELCESVVFEVDHPATQAYKRRSVGSLPPVAKEVRFVPLDFEREDLSAALARAGHHSHIPTFWIWEGVISYLRIHAVRTTLNVIAGRSARGSRLAALYGSSSLGRRLLGVGLRFLGEPFRTHVSPEAMARDLTRRDFKVLSDSNALEWVRQWAEDPPGPVVRGFLRNQWLTIAEKI